MLLKSISNSFIKVFWWPVLFILTSSWHQYHGKQMQNEERHAVSGGYTKTFNLGSALHWQSNR